MVTVDGKMSIDTSSDLASLLGKGRERRKRKQTQQTSNEFYGSVMPSEECACVLEVISLLPCIRKP